VSGISRSAQVGWSGLGVCRVLGLAAGLLLAIAAAAPAIRAANCDPWPGEPTPLPELDDSDRLRAEWAALRMRELATVAARIEPDDPLRAGQLWRRLLCLDPSNDDALAGVLRSRTVRVHRPPLVDAPVAAPADDPWEALDAPLGVRSAPSTRVVRAPSADWTALRGDVAVLEQQVRAARFDEALAGAPTIRSRLSRAPASRERAELISQAEVLTATAELAVGRGAEAEASLRRALAADPELALDPTTTSPKVMRALESARGGGGR
jgi:hypothetical protein